MSTQIIDKLTPQQEKDLQAFYEEMLEVGRTIQPINHEQCEAVITKLYARINRPAPKFFYFDSPMACVAFKEKCGDNTGLTGYSPANNLSVGRHSRSLRSVLELSMTNRLRSILKNGFKSLKPFIGGFPLNMRF